MNRSTFQLWKPFTFNKQDDLKKVKTVNVNFGPQHPAAHGVLRLVLQLNGEIIENSDPHIGLLHRGSEKLMEDRTYLQSLPYFDRFDYISIMSQEHAYCLGIESLMGNTNYSSTLTQVRTLYDELTRILNHMLAIGCHALDVGTMASIWWAFEEREKIMEFYERVSGARFHAAFYRPNEVNLAAVSPFLIEDIVEFIRNCFTTLSEIHNSLTYNKLWKQRLVNVGTYSHKTALDFGLTGVMSRCVGIKRDIRLSKMETYANYYYLNFRSFLGQHGDSYDRFLIRMNEMSESLNICNQVISRIKTNTQKFSTTSPINTKRSVVSNKHEILNYLQLGRRQPTNSYSSMEELIKHFKYWSDGIVVQPNWTYQSLESPKGEFGVSMVSDGSNKPYRCKVRSPSYQNLQALPQIAKGHFLADLVTLVGTIDIVFGEIDR